VRVGTDRGISPPLAYGIDFLPQHNFGVPVEKLPTALTGKLEGNNVLLRHFSGKEGDQIVVAVEARRIGARNRTKTVCQQTKKDYSRSVRTG